jgi:hypothetical protein
MRANHRGTAGLPDARENNPSLVATASASLKRSHVISSFMKA